MNSLSKHEPFFFFCGPTSPKFLFFTLQKLRPSRGFFLLRRGPFPFSFFLGNQNNTPQWPLSPKMEPVTSSTRRTARIYATADIYAATSTHQVPCSVGLIFRNLDFSFDFFTFFTPLATRNRNISNTNSHTLQLLLGGLLQNCTASKQLRNGVNLAISSVNPFQLQSPTRNPSGQSKNRDFFSKFAKKINAERSS